jgi:hypothetical protein
MNNTTNKPTAEQLLATLRDLAKQINRAENIGVRDVVEEAFEMAEAFTALDALMEEGVDVPEAWTDGEVASDEYACDECGHADCACETREHDSAIDASDVGVRGRA